MTTTFTDKLKPTVDYLRLRVQIVARLNEITKHEVSRYPIIKDYNSKKKTVSYYDCDTEKYMKCTLNIHLVGFTISNIREDKQMAIVRRTIEQSKYK